MTEALTGRAVTNPIRGSNMVKLSSVDFSSPKAQKRLIQNVSFIQRTKALVSRTLSAGELATGIRLRLF